ncbi:DnaJ-domain-containing protein [Suillus weaverae]|nr:DnaJ-domain-containing protein [Suillus weaverae]
MRPRGSPSSLPFLNLSPWLSRNKNIALPHSKHYATDSPKHDDGKPSWIHILALGFSSLIHSHGDTIPPQPTQSLRSETNRWVHYTALGLWRDASQDQIKRRYYELSKEHHPDVSQDPSSPEIFRKVTEAYAVLGKKKTRRKYDQYEQLHSALITGLRDQRTGQPSPSSPRPLDPTFWDAIKSGSSTTLYRPPAGYWTAMNKITRDREKEREKEKLQAQAAASSPEKAMPSHDRPKENETKVRFSEFELKVVLAAFSVVFAVVFVDWAERSLGYTRAFLVQLLQENNESESSAIQGRIEDPTSQTTDACTDA